MTREEAVSYVQAVREKFPAPIRISDGIYTGGETYCIGGAFCQWRGVLSRFPNASDLARQLAAANLTLSWDLAYAYAEDITDANDVGQFENAWALLTEALWVGGKAREELFGEHPCSSASPAGR